MQAELSTLCYLERENEYLMLHRVSSRTRALKNACSAKCGKRPAIP